MKLKFLFSVFATGIAMMMSSCSSDDMNFNKENPLYPDVDYDVAEFVSYVNPSSNRYLIRTDVKSYEKFGDNSAWKEFDFSEYIGGSVPGPSSLLIRDGRIFTPLVTFSSLTGPTRLSMAIYILGAVGKIDKNRIFMVDRDYDLSGNRLTLNSEELYVKNQKRSFLWLSAMSEIIRGDSKGFWLYVLKYNETAPEEFYEFDNVEAVYTWVLEAFRERFGEKVNLNDYQSIAILDYPMLTADEIEQELERYKNGELRFVN